MNYLGLCKDGPINMYSVYSQIKSFQYVNMLYMHCSFCTILCTWYSNNNKYLGGQECQIIFFLWVRGLKSRWSVSGFFCSMGRRSRVSYSVPLLVQYFLWHNCNEIAPEIFNLILNAFSIWLWDKHLNVSYIIFFIQMCIPTKYIQELLCMRHIYQYLNLPDNPN